jgi:hypothetical protein
MACSAIRGVIAARRVFSRDAPPFYPINLDEY